MLNIFPDFEQEVFKFAGIYPLKSNDCYWINELCITIGWYQHINLDHWSRSAFSEFINDLKQGRNATFNYVLEKDYKTSWKFEDGKLSLDIWDDPGYLYARRTIDVNDDIIQRLEFIHQKVTEFDKEGSTIIP